jgi:WD40 repeat protein
MGEVSIWDMQTYQCIVLHWNTADMFQLPSGIAISPNGRLVAASCTGDKIVRIWDAVTGQVIERLSGYKEPVGSISFTPDGLALVTGSYEHTITCWDLQGLINPTDTRVLFRPGEPVPAKLKLVYRGECGSTHAMTLEGHKQSVGSLSIHPGGEWFVSGSNDGSVRFWDSQTGRQNLALHISPHQGEFMNF